MHICVHKKAVYGKSQAPQRSSDALIRNTAATAKMPAAITPGLLPKTAATVASAAKLASTHSFRI